MTVTQAPEGLFCVSRLQLAAWLCVNGQKLVDRRLDASRYHVSYYFEHSADIERLVGRWLQKEGTVDLETAAIFAQSVTYEVRIAARLRRGEKITGLHIPRRLRKRLVR